MIRGGDVIEVWYYGAWRGAVVTARYEDGTFRAHVHDVPWVGVARIDPRQQKVRRMPSA